MEVAEGPSDVAEAVSVLSQKADKASFPTENWRVRKDRGGYCSVSPLEIYAVCSPSAVWICADDPQCSDLHSFCDNADLTPLLLLKLIHHPTPGQPQEHLQTKVPTGIPAWPRGLHDPFCRASVFLVSPIIGLEACLSAAAPVTQLSRVNCCCHQQNIGTGGT